MIADPKQEGSQVLAGPYHEAFGQLVEDAAWYDSIVEKCNAKLRKIIESNERKCE